MKRMILSGLVAIITLTLVGVVMNRVMASDEFLATMAPITDLSTGATSTLTIDFNQGGARQRWTLSGNVTITTLANARAGVPYRIYFKQDATGSRTAAWPSNVKWAGGSAPTLTAGAGKQDLVDITWDDRNSQFLAFVSANY